MPDRSGPLALTMGEPAGIGGELTVLAWERRQELDLPPFFAIDDPERLRTIGRNLGRRIQVVEISDPSEATVSFGSALPVLPLPLCAEQPPARPIPANAVCAIESIERAVAAVLSGQATAVVTNPISKQSLIEGAGFAYPGHTEFLAALCGVDRSVMMLATPELRVVPVTIHVPLREVFDLLTSDLIVETGRIVARALQTDFGIARPRLAVSGLNPHAGEGGALGHEEAEVVIPALETLRDEGIAVLGPLPADTMFHPEARARYDAALCMYHDQALIPLKTLDFHRGVNATLGLPIVRTSPDHGTAFDLAGTGRANPASLIEALRMAARMADGRRVA